MKIEIVVHHVEEDRFWAKTPTVPGCTTQDDTMDELMLNLREAIEGYSSVEFR